MAREPLAVWLELDRVHCYDEGDGIGNAEPYLWTVFFKVDGDSVSLGDDLSLHGTATMHTTPGSHGNLGDTDVDAGDNVTVPSAIGEWQTTLRPIPIPDWLASLGVDKIGGVVGVCAVLMEEDWVSDSGAEAGHSALNDFVENAINTLIPQLGILHPEVTDEDIDALTAGAEDQISAAVQAAQGAWDNFGSWLNADDQIGNKVWTFSHDTLVETPDQDFSKRWDNEGDWELFGHVHSSPTCPADVVAGILEALGLISSAERKMSAEGMREFRKKFVAGNAEMGKWWQLAERNAAGIAAVLRRHPEISKRAAAGAFKDIVSVLGNEKAAVPDTLIARATEVLETLAANGPRRLRIDSKAALSLLPEMKGKTLKQASEVLKMRKLTRKPKRLPRPNKPR
jgi:hypothetical protein